MSPHGDAGKKPQLLCLYARGDEDGYKRLTAHLHSINPYVQITDIHGGGSAGQEIKEVWEELIDEARFIVVLASAELFANEGRDRGWHEVVMRALQRPEGPLPIPILYRPFDWQGGPLKGRLVLPRSGLSIVGASDRDQAFALVAEEIAVEVKANLGIHTIPPPSGPPRLAPVPIPRKSIESRATHRPAGTSVLLLHGRDIKSAGEVKTLLRTLQLEPVGPDGAGNVLGAVSRAQQLRLAVKGGLPVVVLFDAEEAAWVRPDLRGTDREPDPASRWQPGTSLVFDAAVAHALAPDRTIFVVQGGMKDIRLPDHVHRWVDLSAKDGREQLRTRLIEVIRHLESRTLSTSGTDWVVTGRFEPATLPETMDPFAAKNRIEGLTASVHELRARVARHRASAATIGLVVGASAAIGIPRILAASTSAHNVINTIPTTTDTLPVPSTSSSQLSTVTPEPTTWEAITTSYADGTSRPPKTLWTPPIWTGNLTLPPTTATPTSTPPTPDTDEIPQSQTDRCRYNKNAPECK